LVRGFPFEPAGSESSSGLHVAAEATKQVPLFRTRCASCGQSTARPGTCWITAGEPLLRCRGAALEMIRYDEAELVRLPTWIAVILMNVASALGPKLLVHFRSTSPDAVNW
jgi:hypothetical protein